MLKKTAIFLATLALLFVPLPWASAHGEVMQTSPTQGSRVLEMPREISIEFDGKLQTLGTSNINVITASDSSGEVISDTVSIVDGSKLSTKILLADTTGLISIHYRIVSEDGHPTEGDYSFTVGQSPIAGNTFSKEKDKPVNRSQAEPRSLSFAAIFTILLLALSGITIIKRSRKR